MTARLRGIIPWGWLEDRLRRARYVPMWDDLGEFAQDTAGWYRRNVWLTQPYRFEVWLEKDALSGIFEDALEPHELILNIGRGYDGWSSSFTASQRVGVGDILLHFGDFGPSGEDMTRSLEQRLAKIGSCPEIVRCALNLDDIERYRLPPDFTKTTDTRAAKFVAKYGDVAVELDALPPDVLQDRLINEVESRMNLDALAETREQEEEDRRRLIEALQQIES